jgi:hypothetical protein
MATLVNRIPRGLRVLLVIVILAAVISQLVPVSYYYPAIGASIVILAVVIFFTYRSRPVAHIEAAAEAMAQESVAQSEDQSESESDAPVTTRYKSQETTLSSSGSMLDFIKGSKSRSSAAMSNSAPEIAEDAQLTAEPPQQAATAEVASPEAVEVEQETGGDAASAEPMPLGGEVSSLTDEDKRKLMNAVWYRCENPFCKYTQFLDVHHIISEKDGGTNKLDNLIVLCPYCNALADKHEIPAGAMQEWIGREDRFKAKPDWPYYK